VPETTTAKTGAPGATRVSIHPGDPMSEVAALSENQ
jgi:hypothetical protein